MADAPRTSKTIYIVYIWFRDDQSTTASCRVTRCFPSIIGSPPAQRTDDKGETHWSWTAVKDGMAFDFASDDVVRPDYRVEQWCRATDERPQDLRERILGVVSRVDEMVEARNGPGKIVHFDWREQKNGTVHGMLQRMVNRQKTTLVLTYQIMRREADELPVESPRTALEIPVFVLTLLR